jgi:hypothetical protein
MREVAAAITQAAITSATISPWSVLRPACPLVGSVGRSELAVTGGHASSSNLARDAEASVIIER